MSLERSPSTQGKTRPSELTESVLNDLPPTLSTEKLHSDLYINSYWAIACPSVLTPQLHSVVSSIHNSFKDIHIWKAVANMGGKRPNARPVRTAARRANSAVQEEANDDCLSDHEEEEIQPLRPKAPATRKKAPARKSGPQNPTQKPKRTNDISSYMSPRKTGSEGVTSAPHTSSKKSISDAEVEVVEDPELPRNHVAPSTAAPHPVPNTGSPDTRDNLRSKNKVVQPAPVPVPSPEDQQCSNGTGDHQRLHGSSTSAGKTTPQKLGRSAVPSPTPSPRKPPRAVYAASGCGNPRRSLGPSSNASSKKSSITAEQRGSNTPGDVAQRRVLPSKRLHGSLEHARTEETSRHVSRRLSGDTDHRNVQTPRSEQEGTRRAPERRNNNTPLKQQRTRKAPPSGDGVDSPTVAESRTMSDSHGRNSHAAGMGRGEQFQSEDRSKLLTISRDVRAVYQSVDDVKAKIESMEATLAEIRTAVTSNAPGKAPSNVTGAGAIKRYNNIMKQLAPDVLSYFPPKLWSHAIYWASIQHAWIHHEHEVLKVSEFDHILSSMFFSLAGHKCLDQFTTTEVGKSAKVYRNLVLSRVIVYAQSNIIRNEQSIDNDGDEDLPYWLQKTEDAQFITADHLKSAQDDCEQQSSNSESYKRRMDIGRGTEQPHNDDVAVYVCTVLYRNMTENFRKRRRTRNHDFTAAFGYLFVLWEQ